MTIAEIVEAFKLNDEQKHYDAAWSCVKILNDERIDDIIKVSSLILYKNCLVIYLPSISLTCYSENYQTISSVNVINLF